LLQSQESPVQAASPLPIQPAKPKRSADRLSSWLDASARYVLIMPAVLIVLLLSVFPLLISLYLAFSRFRFVRGGFEVTFVGFRNFEKLLFGSEQRRFIGRLAEPAEVPLITWGLLGIFAGILLFLLFQYIRSSRFRLFGLVMRLITVTALMGLVTLFALTTVGRGLPGTLFVTLMFVLGGVTLQYFIGLGLALLLTQNLPARRFFRVVFLLPMMITPVGIGFLFKMMTDTLKGPFSPAWLAAGLSDFSLLGQGDTARLAIIIGDTWQWTPFVFIILLAALEGVSKETIEAALVDGAGRFTMFRYIILPEIIPVSTTVILIRLIESFKLIDMPNILTGGGPGTSTETLTLQAYVGWRSGDLGGSAALSYLLLIVSTFTALVFVNFIRRRLMEWIA
jgi:multiple sugar transport system permease protein